MSLTEDLKIYKAMYDLVLKLCDARNRMDKTYKYVMGDKLLERGMECLALIHYANEDKRRREEHLNEFLIKFDIIKTTILILRDKKQFKRDSLLAEVFEKTADVEGQATAWRRASRKPELVGG